LVQTQILGLLTPLMALLLTVTFAVLWRVGCMKRHVLGIAVSYVLFAMGVTTLLTARRRNWIDVAIVAVMAFQAVDFFVRPSMTLLFERTIPAHRLAERIRRAFAGLKHPGLRDDIRLTASFGVATARDGETYKPLLARADEALYRAKSKGRNRVQNAEERGLEEATPKPDPERIELKHAAAER